MVRTGKSLSILVRLQTAVACLEGFSRIIFGKGWNMKLYRFTCVVLTVCLVVNPIHAACPAGDLSGDCIVDFADFAIFAATWLAQGQPTPILSGMTWISISDPGVNEHEAFVGEMGKYEVTNAQYCQFLNEALASGDITVSGNDAIGSNGSNSGADFVGQTYYDCDGWGFTEYGATDGGAARINYGDGAFSVDSGFENHPVTWVSWYGATAFCNYYGFKLPTEWEWQAAADFDGSYTYGCGTTINNTIANYNGSIHPNGTTIVGSFGAYGYGLCDISGNVQEWTSTPDGSARIVRGGHWYNGPTQCGVSYRLNSAPASAWFYLGFRACR